MAYPMEKEDFNSGKLILRLFYDVNVCPYCNIWRQRGCRLKSVQFSRICAIKNIRKVLRCLITVICTKQTIVGARKRIGVKLSGMLNVHT
jgi:hypothetical protein